MLLAGAGIMLPACPFLRSRVSKHVRTICWKWMFHFWCQLAPLVNVARTRNNQLWWLEDQGSRSHVAEDVFGRGIIRKNCTLFHLSITLANT